MYLFNRTCEPSDYDWESDRRQKLEIAFEKRVEELLEESWDQGDWEPGMFDEEAERERIEKQLRKEMGL